MTLSEGLSPILQGSSWGVALAVLTTWLGSTCLMMAPSYRYSGFKNLLLLLVALSLIFFLTPLKLVFWFSFESVSLVMFLMIAGWGYQPERLQSGVYLMYYAVVGGLPLLLALSCLASHILVFMVPLFSTPFMLGLTAAFLFKLPIFGFHMWLPKAHVEAPASCSMFLSGTMLKMGGYGLWGVGKAHVGSWGNWALLGGVIASCMSVLQTDLKGLIAYSSVGHMAMVQAGISCESVLGELGSLMMMVGHGFVSPGLFLLSGVLYEVSASRSLVVVRGLLSASPAAALILGVFACANFSCPFTLSMMSEIYLFPAMLVKGYSSVLLASLILLLSLIYSLSLFNTISHKSGTNSILSINSASYISLTLLLAPTILLFFMV